MPREIGGMRHLLLLIALPATLRAQAPTTLTAAAAEAVVAGCKTHSTAKGQGHAIAVFDAGANLVAALRMDGNRAGIMAFAMAKGRAVALWGFSTAAMADAARETPGFGSA